MTLLFIYKYNNVSQTSQEKDDELDKILPLSLIMGDKWAELGTELNLEMFNDSVWDKSMVGPSLNFFKTCR